MMFTTIMTVMVALNGVGIDLNHGVQQATLEAMRNVVNYEIEDFTVTCEEAKPDRIQFDDEGRVDDIRCVTRDLSGEEHNFDINIEGVSDALSIEIVGVDAIYYDDVDVDFIIKTEDGNVKYWDFDDLMDEIYDYGMQLYEEEFGWLWD